MAKFKVTETVPALITYTYFVDAENEEEAVEKMLNAEEREYEVTHEGDGEIDVEEM